MITFLKTSGKGTRNRHAGRNRLAVLGCLAGVLAQDATAAQPAPAILRFDLTQHLPKVPEAKAEATITKGTDGVFTWTILDGLAQTIVFDQEKLGFDPRNYDELRFDLFPEAAMVDVQMKIKGYPGANETSSWFLKTPLTRDTWNACHFDLHTDDDGFWYKSDKPLPRTVEISLVKRAEGIPGEANGRVAKLRNPRFIRNLFAVSFDHMGAVIDEGPDEIAYTYQLKVENRTDNPLTARLQADGSRTLKYFSVKAPDSTALAAQETKSIPVRLSISRRAAMRLPALYSECIFPKVDLEGVADSEVTPLMGYRRWPMWGVVPLFNRFWWTPATMQAHLEARKAFCPGLENWRANTLRKAAAAMAVDWVLPPANLLPPGYIMGYTCPKCGSNNMRLTEPTSFTKHTCGSCKAVTDGNTGLDRCGVWAYMAGRFEDIRSLSLAALITGDEKYSAKAVKMLLAYAEAYPSYPQSRASSTGGGVRLNTTALYSSYFMHPLGEAWAYLHESKSVTPEIRSKIDAFLLAEAGQIVRHSVLYYNMTTEQYGAYGKVAVDTGYWPLLGEAIYGEFGWHEVVERGFSEDGMSPEAGAYHRAHFYALMNFAMFMSEQGVNLLTARTKRIFDASLNLGVANGDWWPLAYQVYHDPAYLKVINGAGIFVGGIGTPKADLVPANSQIMPGAGYVFLRKGTVAENREMRLNYINTFDRSEYDRFQTLLFHNGAQVDSTVGRINYSHPRTHWMYNTAAHSAIVIDGASQREVTGRLLAYDLSADKPVAVIETLPDAPLYEGVQQVRGIALVEDYYLAFDRVTTGKAHVIDRYQYGPGAATFSISTNKVEKLPALPADGAFTELAGGPVGKTVDVDYGGKLKMRVVADCDISAYKAKAVGSWLGQPMETTFVRASADRAVTLLAAFADDAKGVLPELRIQESSDKRLVLHVKTAKDTYAITVDQVARKVAVSSAGAE